MFVFISQAITSFAHPGRLDSNGGHNDRKNGGYHYHNGGGNGSSSGGSSSTPKTVYPSSVNVKKPTNKIYYGSNTKLSCTVSPSNSNDKTVTWTSSDETIAKISTDGTLSAVGIGDVTITANTSNGITDKLLLSILPVEANSIKFISSPEQMEAGTKEKLKCLILPENTTNKTITWSSNNKDVATINNDGLIEAISKGESIITATTSNGISTGYTIKVFEIEVEEIILAIEEKSYNVGDSINLKVSVSPENATFKDYEITASKTELIKIVNNNSIELLSQGELTITATSKSGKTSSVSIQIILPVSEITTKKDSIKLSVGQNKSVSFEVLPKDATFQNVSWISDNEEIVTVDDSGNITAINNGQTKIRMVSHNGVEKIIDVTVKPDYTWLWIIIGGVVIVLSGFAIVVIILKRKNKIRTQ